MWIDATMTFSLNFLQVFDKIIRPGSGAVILNYGSGSRRQFYHDSFGSATLIVGLADFAGYIGDIMVASVLLFLL
jgi:hypothetical protein